MRINKPQLFNGQYLASNDAILSAFFTNYTAGQDVFAISSGATIKDTLINWSALTGSVYGDAIKIEKDAEQSIKAYIDSKVAGLTSGDIKTISGNLATVSGDLDILETNVSKIGLVKTSALQYTFTDATGASAVIDIPKDQFLTDAAYIPSAEVLRFEFALNDDKSEPGKVVDIPVGELVDEYTAGNGINISDVISGQNIVSVKIDSASEDFLTVDTAGLKLVGVQAAIDTASSAALVDAKAYTNFVSGELDTRITTAQTAADNAKAYTDEQVSVKVNSSDFEAFKTANTGAINAAAAAAAGAVLGTASDTQSDLTIYGVKQYVDAKTDGIATNADLGQLQTTVNSIVNSYVNKNQIATAVEADGNIPTNTLVIDYVASHNAVYKVDNFDSVPTDPTLSGLYIDANGNTKFWDGSSDEFVATSEEVISEIGETSANTAIPDVGAVKTYVAGQIESTIDAESTTNDAKVPTIGAVKAYVDTKLTTAIETAVTFTSKSSVTIGPTAQTVSGRVIAVYSDEGVCYPTITYTGSDADGTVVATISANAELPNCTIVYAKPVVVEE